jgi:nucleoside-triphosphate--adenylate kinase
LKQTTKKRGNAKHEDPVMENFVLRAVRLGSHAVRQRLSYSTGRLTRAAILGAPGSGKGTLSSRLVTDFNFKHVSSGDLLRREIHEESELGQSAAAYIKSGDLVPDTLVVDLVVNNLETSQPFLLDGFPRTIEQAKILDEHVSLNLVLNLEVPEEEIISRLENRRVHVASGRVYHLVWNPPKEEGRDNETGEALIQRPDDTREAIVDRLRNFRELTLPLIDYYDRKGVLLTFKGTESNVIYPEMKTAVEMWSNVEM